MTFFVFFVICRVQGTRLRPNGEKLCNGSNVTFKREPTNAADTYAIRVLFANETIGYLERNVARILAPFLDEKSTDLRVRKIALIIVWKHFRFFHRQMHGIPYSSDAGGSRSWRHRVWDVKVKCKVPADKNEDDDVKQFFKNLPTMTSILGGTQTTLLVTSDTLAESQSSFQ